MRSFAIVSALFAAAAFAAPTSNNMVVRAPAIADIHAQSQTLIDNKAAAGCNVLKCITALAPSAASCAAALAEAGLNPIADAACFATALNSVANPPEACTACKDGD